MPVCLGGVAIGYPTVPQGKVRIRVKISAAHTREDLDRGLDVFKKVSKEPRYAPEHFCGGAVLPLLLIHEPAPY